MVEPTAVGGPDIHGRAFADGLEPLQNLDLARAVFGVLF